MLRDLVKRIWRGNPAVILGAVASGALWAQGAITDAGGAPSWRDAVPIVLGALIRQFVYSPATVDEKHEVIRRLTADL